MRPGLGASTFRTSGLTSSTLIETASAEGRFVSALRLRVAGRGGARWGRGPTGRGPRLTGPAAGSSRRHRAAGAAGHGDARHRRGVGGLVVARIAREEDADAVGVGGDAR